MKVKIMVTKGRNVSEQQYAIPQLQERNAESAINDLMTELLHIGRLDYETSGVIVMEGGENQNE